MARTYFMDWTRDDEAETGITVEYTISGGCPAHYGSLTYPGHPAEAPEVELLIVRAWVIPPKGVSDRDAPDITLTDAEYEKITDYIIENHEEDGPPED